MRTEANICGFRIESISEEYINDIVRVHMRAFPTFFLSFLGHAFLREFYRSFLSDPVGLGLVALSDDGSDCAEMGSPVG